MEKVYDSWYGNPNIKYIFHNEWADPEIEFEGKRYSYWMIEDALWDMFTEDMVEIEKLQPSEVTTDDDWIMEKFAAYVREYAEDYIRDVEYGLNGE